MALHASEQPTPQQPDNRKARRKARSRRKSANRKRHSSVPRNSLTIDEWCASHNVSRSCYEGMKREGRGPDELREGALVRITPQANENWCRERESKAAE